MAGNKKKITGADLKKLASLKKKKKKKTRKT